MDNITAQIKILNKIYLDMKHNFETLKKMFRDNSGIKQKIILSEQMMNQVYMSIMQKIESEEINSEFLKIIRGIKDEKKHSKD